MTYKNITKKVSFISVAATETSIIKPTAETENTTQAKEQNQAILQSATSTANSAPSIPITATAHATATATSQAIATATSQATATAPITSQPTGDIIKAIITQEPATATAASTSTPLINSAENATGTTNITGAATATAATGAATTVVNATDTQDKLIIENADYLRHERDTSVTILKGHVLIRYEDAILTCDEAALYDKTDSVTATGNITVTTPNSRINGESIYYNFKSDYFESFNASGYATAPGVTGYIYFRGSRVSGDANKISISNAVFSTCGPYCPSEYHFSAKTVAIYPNRKLLARKVVVYIRSTPIAYLPVYYQSLKNKENYMPTFGYDKIRGVYVNTKYPYLSKDLISGIVLLNFASRVGTEWGANNKYTFKKIGGEGAANFLFNNEKTTGNKNSRVGITQAFKFWKKITGNLSLNRDNFYNVNNPNSRGNTNNFNIDSTITQSTTKSATFRFSRSTSRGSLPYKSYGLSRRLLLGKKLSIDYNYNGTSQAVSLFSPDVTASFGSNVRYLSDKFSIDLKTTKKLDPASGRFDQTSDYRAVDTRLPEVEIKLMPKIWQKILPPRYIPITSASIMNSRFRYGFRNNSKILRRNAITTEARKSIDITKRLAIDSSENLRQFFYSTKEAKYTLTNNTNLRYKFSETAVLGINYNKVGDSGGSPYPLDTVNDAITLGGNFGINKPKTTFSMGTSYNYKNVMYGPYSPLYFSYNRGASANSVVTISGSRDLNSSLWLPAQTNLMLTRKNTKIVSSASWDMKNFQLTTLDLKSEHKYRNGWYVQLHGVSEKNTPYGFLREIIATHTRCCTYSQFAYDTIREEFKFQYQIIAFPGKAFGLTQGAQGIQMEQNLFELKSENQNQ